MPTKYVLIQHLVVITRFTSDRVADNGGTLFPPECEVLEKKEQVHQVLFNKSCMVKKTDNFHNYINCKAYIRL